MLDAGLYQLRPFAEDDAASFAEAARESAASSGRWMPWARPDYTAYDAHCWFAACELARANGTAHEFGIYTRAGRLVGGCGLNRVNSTLRLCNLGYWIRTSERRQGAGLAAVLALRDFAWLRLPVDRIEIVVATGNAPSSALARKSGAVHEGVARARLQVDSRAVDADMYAFVRST